MLDDVFYYLPSKKQILKVSEGSGCNLSCKDKLDGYVDYIDYSIYDAMMLNPEDNEVDGGCMLFKEFLSEKYHSLDCVVPDVIEFAYGVKSILVKRVRLDGTALIRGLIGTPALYEQLAEECAGLARVALEKARILRNNNPTPVTISEVDTLIEDDVANIALCINQLGLTPEEDAQAVKLRRWIDRIEKKED